MLDTRLLILGRGNGGGGSITGAVRYDEAQSLTDSQKQQARENIGVDLSGNLKRQVVESLPTESIDTNTIYMVPNGETSGTNVYTEYMYINNAWEIIGSTDVDLSDYYTKGQVDTALGTKANSSDVYTKTEVDAKDWYGTKTEYDAIAVKDPNVTYHIEGGIVVTWDSITGKPTFSAVATSGSYNDLTDKPTIPTVPTNVSAFNNDAGYLTEHQSLEGYATETWVEGKGYSTFSGSYNDLTDKPTIPTVPTNVSAFTNDSDYTTKAYVDSLVGTINNELTTI